MSGGSRLFRRVALAALLLVAIVQLIPVGHRHSNPPVVGEPKWDSIATRASFDRSCGDCHSHATRWPWYSHVAPVSWLIAHDVEEGREHFNVSEWGLPRRNDGDEASEKLRDGDMPPRVYLLAHPEARLSAAEREVLARGLDATFGSR